MTHRCSVTTTDPAMEWLGCDNAAVTLWIQIMDVLLVIAFDDEAGAYAGAGAKGGRREMLFERNDHHEERRERSDADRPGKAARHL